MWHVGWSSSFYGAHFFTVLGNIIWVVTSGVSRRRMHFSFQDDSCDAQKDNNLISTALLSLLSKIIICFSEEITTSCIWRYHSTTLVTLTLWQRWPPCVCDPPAGRVSRVTSCWHVPRTAWWQWWRPQGWRVHPATRSCSVAGNVVRSLHASVTIFKVIFSVRFFIKLCP